ncbi:MAG: rRNA maturation RNase YbeY [Deltaproteobacteria bacterium]|nr:MAG: rRNA maturation RNase YbeY [Deltaproteobacteria bacterium]
MEIQIKCQQQIPGLGKQEIKQNLAKVLNDLGCHDAELSILITDDAGIAELNQHYLGTKGPTNVLAFPMGGGSETDYHSSMLGDVVISAQTAQLESEEVNEPVSSTVMRLLVHGLLHLLGFDHTRSIKDARRMEKEEARLMLLIKED